MSPAAFKRWRKARNITQSELAAALGLHPITISKIERGVLPFKGTIATKLLKVQQRGLEAKELLERKAQ